ncbi:tyrosine-type recombinase/integrase [Streptomyces sp. NPDC055134]
MLDRFHRLSDEVGVPIITVHDLRHLAATITITAGVPLTVVSKTLRHSTLSTTANLYNHLTQQAAREAVDTIDRTLTQAETTSLRTNRPSPPRPPRDHIRSLREALRRLREPAPPAFSTTASQPHPRRATTLRPPRAGTHESRPLDHERTASDLRQHKSGRQDLNLRLLDPQLRQHDHQNRVAHSARSRLMRVLSHACTLLVASRLTLTIAHSRTGL